MKYFWEDLRAYDTDPIVQSEQFRLHVNDDETIRREGIRHGGPSCHA